MEQQQEQVRSFDFSRILLPDQFDWLFLAEVGFRTFFMFILLLIFFKLSGKRSIYQLSLFELAIIVGLGSAAGDPMFYYDVGLLPVFVVFLVISILYKALTNLTSRNEAAEKFIEGKPDPLLINDLMITKNLDSQTISYDEFFSFLRIRNIEHLGQVKAAYLEVNGDISVFFYPDNEVKPGLPIIPEAIKYHYTTVKISGLHSCLKCGFTTNFNQGTEPVCPNCGNNQWVRSNNSLRIS